MMPNATLFAMAVWFALLIAFAYKFIWPPLMSAIDSRNKKIAEGLAAAHDRGLIHRDIKPGNIWLEAGKDRVKIVDFGLARGQGEDSNLTQQGAILGTPSFMAPEQARNQPLDGRCDLFSLGCVLYEMSTGQMPFQGTDPISTIMAVARCDASGMPARSTPRSKR